MTAAVSRLRRFAQVLAAHAAGVLPPERRAWADAMRHELDHIDGDLDAVTWAAGCVLASYVERSGIADLLHTWTARGLLALLMATQVLSMLFATMMTVAYRGGYLRVARFLGGFTPGDDYHRFIPLMDATPWWTHAMWVGASVLFFISALQLLRDRRAAFPLFAAAWVLGTAGNLISQATPEYQAVFSFASPMVTRDYVLPIMTSLLTASIGAALWIHARFSLAHTTSPRPPRP